jgi:phosphoribosylaminoimidazole-succinocarboxamide synthase
MTTAMADSVLLSADLPGLERVARGKVRDVFAVDDGLLLVATDRVSAFDVVMNEGIPHKGRVLTAVSAFWFDQLRDVVPNHVITTDVTAMPAAVAPHHEVLRGRTTYCRRANPLPVEFVVRGYLAGSGLKEYRAKGSICGVPLPPGLVESSRLPEPILTPTTKAAVGHDEPITFEQVREQLGAKIADRARAVALAIFDRASALAEKRGLLLADTKFEFGLIHGELVWIDEALTPDSSRYWSKAEWKEGVAQQPFDKQVLRDYLLKQDWNQKPPPPPLSPEIVAETSRRYLESARILTGRDVLASNEPRRKTTQVAIVMGSDSDLETLQGGIQQLSDLGVPFEVRVLSAHRTPDAAQRFAREAEGRGVKVIIAAAGGAAHLAGAMAAHSMLPVIGVPIASSPLSGFDALLSTVMMPPGIPVATVAVGKMGGTNAALLAVEILALFDPEMKKKLVAFRAAQEKKVLAKDQEIRSRYS